MTAVVRVPIAALVLILASTRAPAAGAPGAGAPLLAEADAVVAVQIRRTDYTATASDGPMYAEAQIVGVVKGPLGLGTTLRFGEAAACGPDYEREERRILFLQRVRSPQYFRSASWSTICRPGDRFNVFFAVEGLSGLSAAALQKFLDEVAAIRRTPPRLQVEVARRERSALLLLVSLVNRGPEPLWLNPALVTLSFEARGIRVYRKVRFQDLPPSWRRVPPGAALPGTVRLAGREVRGEERVLFIVTHSGVYYPYRSWAGTVTASTALNK